MLKTRKQSGRAKINFSEEEILEQNFKNKTGKVQCPTTDRGSILAVGIQTEVGILKKIVSPQNPHDL